MSNFVGLDGREHHTGEVLHLEGILQTGGNTCLGKQIDKQSTVVSRSFYDSVMLVLGDGLDELISF